MSESIPDRIWKIVSSTADDQTKTKDLHRMFAGALEELLAALKEDLVRICDGATGVVKGSTPTIDWEDVFNG